MSTKHFDLATLIAQQIVRTVADVAVEYSGLEGAEREELRDKIEARAKERLKLQ